MKICRYHMQRLQQAIKDKGLWEFVAKSEAEAQAKTTREIMAPKELRSYFDPLIMANFIIVNNFTLQLHRRLSSNNCPLCSLDGVEDDMADAWIISATERIQAAARALKLISA